MKNLKGSLILLMAALIWGTAFVAQTSAANSVQTFTMNASRSLVGALFLLIVIAIRDMVKRARGKTGDNDLKQDKLSEKTSWPVMGGICCGCMLFCAMGFQQAGIGAYPEGIAIAGRSGFLTATYVVMVAIFVQLRGKKLHPFVLMSIVGTIFGLYLLCMSGGFSHLYFGDLLEILCAVCFTGHILVADHFRKVDSIKLSCLQFLTCGILSGAVCLFTESVSVSALLDAAVPILYAGIMSSGVAYTLQLVGQKFAEPAVASIVMSLESVFAALAGWVILHERMQTRELIGCILVFAAVILAQIPEFLTKKSDETE
ncbi:MAG: DMT family transporter [Eubacteriales bacterium]|nr:DMT family transporter [Lachnospiraceae bacterium]MDO5126434.1 DMT family transporter [Eubacteriales bacterium]